MAAKKNPQAESPWSIAFTPVRVSSPVPPDDDFLRLPRPEFRTYCRVCLCGEHDQEWVGSGRPAHKYDAQTRMKTHLFGKYIEVDPSVQAAYERDTPTSEPVKRPIMTNENTPPYVPWVDPDPSERIPFNDVVEGRRRLKVEARALGHVIGTFRAFGRRRNRTFSAECNRCRGVVVEDQTKGLFMTKVVRDPCAGTSQRRDGHGERRS
jgi:hypothetical protein